MPPPLSLACAGAALLALPGLPGLPVGGLHRLGSSRPGTEELLFRRRPGAHALLASVLGAAVILLVGMPLGPPVGLAAGWVATRVCRRLEPAGQRRIRQARQADLPAVLDLLAVCLGSGLPLAPALDLVATALPGALSADLLTVARLQRLGAGAAAAWDGVRADPLLGPVARAATRSGESGSALARTFERLAAEHRSDAVQRAEAGARRAGVLAMAPLGLCHLPAFVCLGVVPVVLGIARQVLGATLTGPGWSG